MKTDEMRQCELCKKWYWNELLVRVGIHDGDALMVYVCKPCWLNLPKGVRMENAHLP